jgi:hypothetical protein
MPGDASISALLDSAQRLLGEEITPHLDQERRYLALMIGSAMRMAARQAEQSERLAQAQAALLDLTQETSDEQYEPPVDPPRALIAAIRAGVTDAGQRVHSLLWTDAVVRTSVTKPSMLSRIERRLAGLPGDEGGT